MSYAVSLFCDVSAVFWFEFNECFLETCKIWNSNLSLAVV